VTTVTTTSRRTVTTVGRRRRIVDFLFRFQSYFGLLIIFVLAIVFSPVRNGVNLFLSERNLLNVLMFASETGILAVGMTLVILVGGIDLSVGSVMALIGVISADFLMNTKQAVILGTPIGFGPLPALLVFAISIGIGLLIGWFNGWTAERFRIPSFVTTLAMMIMARGLAREWVGNNSIPIAYDTGAGNSQYSTGAFGDPLFGLIGRTIPDTNIPVPALIMLACAIVFGFILAYTTFGRRIYAVGGNPIAARLSGISVARLRIYTFMICSALAAVAGMIHASRLNQGSPNESINYELNAIAAVVIGGASLSGGKGTIIGAIGGALILQILDNILGLNNISSNTQLIVKGLLVIAAVALQQLKPATEAA
jgi:ribose transport system permease protein